MSEIVAVLLFLVAVLGILLGGLYCLYWNQRTTIEFLHADFKNLFSEYKKCLQERRQSDD